MAVVGAVAAVAALAGGVVQGQRAEHAQKKALTRQQEVQKTAEASALSQQKQSEMEFNRANRKTPDIGALLAGEQAAALGGAGSTILTGGASNSRLGQSSLLGG